MENKIPYLGITILSFVAIHLHLTKLCYNIGELTHFTFSFFQGQNNQFPLIKTLATFSMLYIA